MCGTLQANYKHSVPKRAESRVKNIYIPEFGSTKLRINGTYRMFHESEL